MSGHTLLRQLNVWSHTTETAECLVSHYFQYFDRLVDRTNNDGGGKYFQPTKYEEEKKKLGAKISQEGQDTSRGGGGQKISFHATLSEIEIFLLTF